MSSTKAQFAFALEYVSNIETAKRFAVDVLGLEIDREAPTFVQFKSGYAITSDERMEPGLAGGPELWWLVEDADSAFGDMSAQADVSMPPRQMPFGTCFGIKDQAGQVHYVLEFARTRPSQPVA